MLPIPRAGCSAFSYGMESASPRVLGSMNKKIKPAQLAEALELAHRAEIGFGGNFIFGDVAETPETISETLGFYVQNCLQDNVFLGEIRPYPGSALFEGLLKQGVIHDKLRYYETIDQVRFNMTAMPDEQWLSCMAQILSLASFPLVKCVDATSLEREPPQVAKRMAADLGRTVWRIGSQCPYCSRGCEYLEIVDEKRVLQAGLIVVTACASCHRRFRINVPVESTAVCAGTPEARTTGQVDQETRRLIPELRREAQRRMDAGELKEAGQIYLQALGLCAEDLQLWNDVVAFASAIGDLNLEHEAQRRIKELEGPWGAAG